MSAQVERLPDAYAKTAGGNNQKLLSLWEGALCEARSDLAAVDEAAALEKAAGQTLDEFGKMAGVRRGALDDTQYRYLIGSRMVRNFVRGDYESVVSALAAVFAVEKSEVALGDDDAQSGVACVRHLPFAVLQHAGFTTAQATGIIEQLLPVGVRLSGGQFEGTFQFAQGDEMQQDEEAGFGNEEQTVGGYFGQVAGDENAAPLPL